LGKRDRREEDMLDLGEVACLVCVLVQRIRKDKETAKGKRKQSGERS
jgi:hypothetical protein